MNQLNSICGGVFFLIIVISSILFESAYADSIRFGVAIERMITSEASPIEAGKMDSALIYIEKNSFSFSFGNAHSKQACNNNIRIYRLDYSPNILKRSKYFDGLLGLGYHSFPGNYSINCEATGALINLPTPYIGIRKVLKSKPINLGIEARAHTFGIAIQARIGF